MRAESVVSALLVSLISFPSVLAMPATIAMSAAMDGGDGLTIKVSQPVVVSPKLLRVVLPFKAEEGNSDRAIERLAKHIESVSNALKELGAIPTSIEFSPVESKMSGLTPSISSQLGGDQQVWQAQPAGFAFEAEGGQPVAVPILADVSVASANGVQNEALKSLPKIGVANSIAAADWDVAGKSFSEIAILKSKLLASIASKKLDGSDLYHQFTTEQEDEIFEVTKIDIRNGDTRSIFSTPIASSKWLFIGIIPDGDYETALKRAFQSVDKRAKQAAIAGNLSLGKKEYVQVQVESRSSSFTAIQAQAMYSVYQTPSTAAPIDWEPALQPDEYSCENPNLLSKNLELTVRFKIE